MHGTRTGCPCPHSGSPALGPARIRARRPMRPASTPLRGQRGGRFSGLARRVSSPGVYAWVADPPHFQPASAGFSNNGFGRLTARAKAVPAKAVQNGLEASCTPTDWSFSGRTNVVPSSHKAPESLDQLGMADGAVQPSGRCNREPTLFWSWVTTRKPGRSFGSLLARSILGGTMLPSSTLPAAGCFSANAICGTPRRGRPSRGSGEPLSLGLIMPPTTCHEASATL